MSVAHEREDLQRIYCETHKCEITVTGCLARQNQAEGGARSSGGWGVSRNTKTVPYDLACKDCEQGQKIAAGEIPSSQVEKQEAPKPKIKPILTVIDEHGNTVGQPAQYNDETGRQKKASPLEEQKVPFPEKANWIKKPPATTESGPPEVPYGYCQCGCGQKAPIAKNTDNPKGHIAGQPVRYVKGHHNRNKKWAIKEEPEMKNDNPNIPYGFCHCGCGEKTRISAKGEPSKFIKGHNRKKEIVEASQKDWLTALRQLQDGRELECELVRQSVENLREVDAQAVWLLAEKLREGRS